MTMVSFKGAHLVKDIILTCLRWYLAYPLSYRHVEKYVQQGGGRRLSPTDLRLRAPVLYSTFLPNGQFVTPPL